MEGYESTLGYEVLKYIQIRKLKIMYQGRIPKNYALRDQQARGWLRGGMNCA